jgi:hypothetical protein
MYTGILSTIFMARYVAERRSKEGVFRSAVNPLSAHSSTPDGSDMLLLAHRAHKRRRLEDEDGITVSDSVAYSTNGMDVNHISADHSEPRPQTCSPDWERLRILPSCWSEQWPRHHSQSI